MSEDTEKPESYNYLSYVLAMYGEDEDRDESLWTGNFTGDVLPYFIPTFE